ncbi:MAG: KamA family radical SAM protein [Bdellovibrionota bacterium]|nr:KamA family radical SAM protein [Bdellovibrionota bacterium]
MTTLNLWQEEFRNALRNTKDLELFFEKKFPKLKDYPVFLPKSFAEKVKKLGESGPLWKQFLPDIKEKEAKGFTDPIGDQENNTAPQLIHRYKNRALFTPTTICPVLCRYCFRKNELNQKLTLFKPELEKTIQYLKDHPEIEELIFTGGDPFILSDQQLSFYIEQFSKIKSLKYLRFHTRTPVIIPSRVTENLIALLKKAKNNFNNVSLAIHTNHENEIDTEVEKALLKLKESGVMLLAQTVLLKGVNDSGPALKTLFSKLIDLGIRPYYLHHPDQAKGTTHFYLELEEGRHIYSQLRDHLPGWAIPSYIIDIPGGEGKVSAFNPETYEFSGNLINRKGEIVKHLTE